MKVLSIIIMVTSTSVQELPSSCASWIPLHGLISQIAQRVAFRFAKLRSSI